MLRLYFIERTEIYHMNTQMCTLLHIFKKFFLADFNVACLSKNLIPNFYFSNEINTII